MITTQVYLIMYLLMFVAAVRLRRNEPDHPRGYRAPMLVGAVRRRLRRLAGGAAHRLRPAVAVRRRQHRRLLPHRRRRSARPRAARPVPVLPVPQAVLEAARSRARRRCRRHERPDPERGRATRSGRWIYWTASGLLVVGDGRRAVHVQRGPFQRSRPRTRPTSSSRRRRRRAEHRRRRTRSSGCSATTAVRCARTRSDALRQGDPLSDSSPTAPPAPDSGRSSPTTGSSRGSCSCIEVYCPEELEDFKELVDDLEVRRRDPGMTTVHRRHRRRASTALMPRVRAELAELVAIPSVADAAAVPAGGVRARSRSGCWTRSARLGFADIAAASSTADGSEAVVGSRPGPGPGRSDGAALRALRRPAAARRRRLADAAVRAHRGRRPLVRPRRRGLQGQHPHAPDAPCGRSGDDVPVNLKLVVEGSEEQGTGGLEEFVHAEPRPAAGRRDPGVRHGQRRGRRSRPSTVSLRGMVNVVVHVEALPSELHSGMFGGAGARRAGRAGRDARHPARRRRATPRSTGLDDTQNWTGAPYDPPSSSAPTPGSLDGVRLLGDGSVSDMLWARPAVTDPGHRLPTGGRARPRPSCRGAAPG